VHIGASDIVVDCLQMDKELKQMLEPVKVKSVLLGLVRAQQFKLKRVNIG
jgi:hypothetical protein